MSFSDADLRAYLAGDASQATAIEAALAADPALEDRLMALDTVAPMVAGAFADVGEDRPVLQIAPPADARRPIWPLLASACLGGLIVAASLWPRAQTPDWTMQVAAYQALYSAETISIVAADAADIAQQFDHLSTNLGAAPDLAALQNLPGLRLLRAQVLTHAGAPLGQIVFADSTGRPVALCYIASTEDRSGTSTQRGLAGAHFTSHGFAYYLVGTRTEADAQDLATAIQSALAS